MTNQLTRVFFCSVSEMCNNMAPTHFMFRHKGLLKTVIVPISGPSLLVNRLQTDPNRSLIQLFSIAVVYVYLYLYSIHIHLCIYIYISHCLIEYRHSQLHRTYSSARRCFWPRPAAPWRCRFATRSELEGLSFHDVISTIGAIGI